MPLLQQLSNGEIAVKNDGTVEELNMVWKRIFPNCVTISGGERYYFKAPNLDVWSCSCKTDLPVYSVKDFIEEMDEESVRNAMLDLNARYGVKLPDDFVLPEKWCVKVTEENEGVLNNYLHSHKQNYATYTKKWLVEKKTDKPLYFLCESHGNCHSSYCEETYSKYTLITFDQFKKYVLKEDEKKDDNVSAVFIPEKKEMDLSDCKPTEKMQREIDTALDKIGYKKTSSDKFAVMLTDSGAPTKLHDSYESAEKECLRLVKETKRDGYVLKLVSKISNEIKIEKV